MSFLSVLLFQNKEKVFDIV